MYACSGLSLTELYWNYAQVSDYRIDLGLVKYKSITQFYPQKYNSILSTFQLLMFLQCNPKLNEQLFPCRRSPCLPHQYRMQWVPFWRNCTIAAKLGRIGPLIALNVSRISQIGHWLTVFIVRLIPWNPSKETASCVGMTWMRDLS